jgi:TRAP-type C4-dicarboxylate transport system substrate-binding protein
VIEEFANRVEQLSGGGLRIEPVWRASGGDLRAWDQRVARKVVEGELDLGLIPARAWDTEGVTSLRALQAPFLISDDALLDQVTNGPLAGKMLGGLAEVGVVGLALNRTSCATRSGWDRRCCRSMTTTARGSAPRSPRSHSTFCALWGRSPST